MPYTESGGDTLEPAPSTELTRQCAQETTPTGVAAVAGTSRKSGRLSQPPKASADYVLY